MYVSVFIITISVLLFVYWFRYSCLLILGERSARNHALEVAQANHLCFLEHRNRLSESEFVPLAPIYDSLERDFRLITYLLKHAGGFHAATHSFERAVLTLDFRVMQIWYMLMHRVSMEQSRNALLEMTAILQHFAHSMGEHRQAMSARA